MIVQLPTLAVLLSARWILLVSCLVLLLTEPKTQFFHPFPVYA